MPGLADLIPTTPVSAPVDVSAPAAPPPPPAPRPSRLKALIQAMQFLPALTGGKTGFGAFFAGWEHAEQQRQAQQLEQRRQSLEEQQQQDTIRQRDRTQRAAAAQFGLKAGEDLLQEEDPADFLQHQQLLSRAMSDAGFDPAPIQRLTFPQKNAAAAVRRELAAGLANAEKRLGPDFYPTVARDRASGEADGPDAVKMQLRDGTLIRLNVAHDIINPPLYKGGEPLMPTPAPAGAPFTLSPGQTRYNQKGEPIATGPAKAETASPGSVEWYTDQALKVFKGTHNGREPTPEEAQTVADTALTRRAAAGRDQDATDLSKAMARLNLSLGELRLKEAQQPKTPSQSETTNATYAMRIEQAQPILLQLESAISGMTFARFSVESRLPAAGQSALMQSYEQASRNFINAVLRRESGAVISPSEFAEARKQYLPQPGDTEQTLSQKRRNREIAFSTFKRGAGTAYEPPPSIEGTAGWIDLGGGVKVRQKP